MNDDAMKRVYKQAIYSEMRRRIVMITGSRDYWIGGTDQLIAVADILEDDLQHALMSLCFPLAVALDKMEIDTMQALVHGIRKIGPVSFETMA